MTVVHRSAALLALVVPAMLHAQALGGRALDRARGTPLPNLRTFARIPDSDSTVEARTATDGTFILLLPRPGRYQLHFALDSLTELLSEPFDVGADDFVQREFRLAPPERPYSATEVQTPVVPLPGNVGPRYPALLRDQSIEGKVIAEFVVDTTGAVRPGSVRVLMFSHVGFIQAVQEAVPAMRFRPAELGGRKVPQLVQQPFEFRLGGTPSGLPLPRPVP